MPLPKCQNSFADTDNCLGTFSPHVEASSRQDLKQLTARVEEECPTSEEMKRGLFSRRCGGGGGGGGDSGEGGEVGDGGGAGSGESAEGGGNGGNGRQSSSEEAPGEVQTVTVTTPSNLNPEPVDQQQDVALFEQKGLSTRCAFQAAFSGWEAGLLCDLIEKEVARHDQPAPPAGSPSSSPPAAKAPANPPKPPSAPVKPAPAPHAPPAPPKKSGGQASGAPRQDIPRRGRHALLARTPDEEPVEECRRALMSRDPEAINRRCGVGGGAGGGGDSSEGGRPESEGPSDIPSPQDLEPIVVASNNYGLDSACAAVAANRGYAQGLLCSFLESGGSLSDLLGTTTPKPSPPPKASASAPVNPQPVVASRPKAPAPPPAVPPKNGGSTRPGPSKMPPRRRGLKGTGKQHCGAVTVGTGDEVQKCEEIGFSGLRELEDVKLAD